MVQTLSCSIRRLLQHWTESSIIPSSKEVQSGGTKSTKRVPFPSWKTDRLPDLRVLPGHWRQWFRRELCRPIYNCSSKCRYSGIRFKVGRNSIVNDENPTWWHLGKIVQTKNTRVWETQDRIGIVWPGDSPEEVRTWLSQIENDGEKKYRARFTKQEFWGQKRKLWKKRRSQESGTKQRGQRILGDWQWETIGQCSKGDNCSFRHDVNKRAKMTQPNPSPSSFMQQNEKKCVENPKSQRKESQWKNVSMALQGLPQRNLHQFILWKVASTRMLVLTRPRVVVGLGKSAHMHIVRLMNSRLKGPKRMMTKVQWLCWRKVIGMKEDPLPTNVTIDQGNLIRGVIRSWDEERQLGCVFQDMTPPKSILRKCTDMRKPIERVKFTKAVARHAYIRDQNPSLGLICPGDSVSGRDRVARARCPLSSVEAGQKCIQITGAWKSNILLLNKIGVYLHQVLNLRNENLLWTPERRCTWSAKRTWVMLKWIPWRNRVVQR